MKTISKFLSLALIASLMAACGSKEAKTDATENKEAELPLVKVQKVSEQEVPRIMEYTATVEAYKTNNISTSTMNRIKKITVDVGSNVRAGQTLVVLDDVNISQAEMRLANQQRNYDRAVQLLNIGGGTQQSVDQLKTELDAAARALQNMKENAVLTAPMSGVVTARNYDPGDMTGSLPILVVEQQNPVKVILNVSENDYPNVKLGQKVDVRLDVYGDEVFSGTIHLIHPSVDTATRTFQVEVTINNGGSRVRTGMFARVSINYGTANHVVVPDLAVIKQQGSAVRYVYVYKDGKVEIRNVTLGQRLDNAYELIDGVANGEEVVVSGHGRLTDGVQVKVTE